MSNNNGYIKLSRNIMSHWIWQDAERFQWWCYLLISAEWCDRKVLVNSHMITLQRGQLVESAASLAQRWNKCKPTIIKFLNLLHSDGMIDRSILYGSISVITICNYDTWQGEDDEGVDGSFDGTLDTSLDGSLYASPINKNIKNIKKDKNINFSFNKLNDKSKNEFSTGSPVNYDSLITYFNEKTNGIFGIIRLPISEKRKGMMRARIREYGEQSFREVIDKASASSFLKGQNARSWKMSFDWMIKPTNYDKILSGNYDNRKSMTIPDINKLFDDD